MKTKTIGSRRVTAALYFASFMATWNAHTAKFTRKLAISTSSFIKLQYKYCPLANIPVPPFQMYQVHPKEGAEVSRVRRQKFYS